MSTETFRTLEVSDPAIAPEGLSFVTVKSRALRRRADVTVFVPPVLKRMPKVSVVVLLHGVFGSHWAWALKGAAHLTAARLMVEGALPPVALLMPSDGLWGDGSGYVAHADHDAERWIIEEMPALASELVEGCTMDSSLLVAGLSMGGFGALRLAGKYPDRITAAASLSAVTEAAQFDALLEERRDAWSTAPADRSVLAALMQGDMSRLPPLRIDCGLDDPYLESNRELHRALVEMGVAHRYAEAPGGHDWAYWTTTLEATLRFFGRVLRPPEGNA